jgi:DnaD/phage-associated family protein
MHPWRKIRIEWLSSSRLRKVSDSAFRMWLMLITAQDDDGYFELEDAKLAQLVAGTSTWNSERCKALIEELVEVGLIIRDGNFIVLYRGSEFNGMLRPERPSSGFYYRSDEQRQVTETLLTVSDSQVTAIGGLEERKKRGEKDKKKIKRRGEENPSSIDEKTSNLDTLLDHLENVCERDLGRVETSLSTTLNEFANQHPDLPVQWIDLAFEEAFSYKKVSWAYVAAVLEAWSEQGYSGKERKEDTNGKSRKDSSNDAKRNRPGAGFKPLSGRRARVS